ncbi:RsmB/NOP family class I SAM-dependent RNA methyltransferase [Qingshengfaniella alkalisoli]|uniref:Methyltransferase domain-containing protein n=1 Tax=Qingshengfaniella alkalisoli TaxID=2599296 RepID=A0A5B8IWL8_9RHOB|nr:transcription antitermination factor NusB [Qingshengfaniella alkalisoli]QDY69933.1 methyltransferase domain-containing protein [Qingshengfaniella alkalisoli]
MNRVPSSDATSARHAAVGLLTAVLEDRQLLSTILDAPNGPIAGLAPADRARAQRLATTTLRNVARADKCLGPHLRKTPPPYVRNLLRLSVVELCEDKAAAHGVVDTAVTLMRRRRKTARMSGMVNAILRKVALEGSDMWPSIPAQRLPKWLRGRLISAYGSDVVARIEAVHAMTPPIDMTVKGEAPAIEGSVVLPTGSLRLAQAGKVSDLPGYSSGTFWVQDAAAAIPARLLGAETGEAVLDMCAAPGGKTLQMASAGAQVTALDISDKRLARLKENLQRTKLSADVVTGDALEWRGGPFDAVLLDAPCSATGTIRRHPDLPFVKSKVDIRPLVELQRAMLNHALNLLRPGGRLVFCTCSLLPEEGEAQIDELLARHPNLKPDYAAMQADWLDDAWRVPQGLRLRPDFWADLGGMDGFFISALRKAESP